MHPGSDTPLILKLCSHSRRSLTRLYVALDSCLAGFWLGVLHRETVHRMDEICYNHTPSYCRESWNRSGLFGWERKVVDTYFRGRERLLIGGAGGGREVLALCQLGYEAEGFECNARLAQFANRLLEKEALAARVHVASRDRSFRNGCRYDGIIVGWAAYMLIQGRQRRIEFLRELRAQMGEGAPLLLSFYYRSGTERRFRWIARIGNIFRHLLRREMLDVGDDLASHHEHRFLNYVHYFTREQIASELEEAGFSLEYYSTRGYGHAVGAAAPDGRLRVTDRGPARQGRSDTPSLAVPAGSPASDRDS